MEDTVRIRAEEETSPRDEVDDLLEAVLDQEVVTPEHADFDRLQAVMIPTADRPRAIVRPKDATQVAQAVGAAVRAGLAPAVRGGGHSGAGHSTVDRGVVIDLRELRRIDIDAEARTAWFGAGLTAGEVTRAAGEHGLAIGFGDNASVGIAGLTLGGGVGYLSRAHGLTIDNLDAAEIVTAEGAILEVDGERDPDLFWAIRGGGGNFGIATRFKYRLVPVARVTGGPLVLPATPEVLAGFLSEAAAAPNELTAIANVVAAPPLPFLPEEVHGDLVLMIEACFCGSAEDADRAFAPFRALAQAHADLIGPKEYADLFQPFPDDYHPRVALRNQFLDAVDIDLATEIVGELVAAQGGRAMMQFRVLGGAIDSVGRSETAYAHRGAGMLTMLASFYDEPDERTAHESWVRAFADRLDARGASVNFLGDEGPERVRDAYPGETFGRLAEIKARYDPENLFRRNQNVPPFGSSARSG